MVENYVEQRIYRRGETFDQLAAALGLSVPGLRKWARKGAVPGAALHRGKWVLHGPLTEKRIEGVRSSLRLKPALSRAWTERRLGGRRTPKAPLKKRHARTVLTRYVKTLDRVESTIHDAASGAPDQLRVEAVSAFHELCDASYALGCLLRQQEPSPQHWAQYNNCIPIVRDLIEFKGGSWRDHWAPAWSMLNDEKSLIRQFAEALIPLGLGLFDAPLAVAPKLKEIFADYVSLPSGAKDLSRFIEDAGAHISEWQTCYLQYTAKRTTLESVGGLGSHRPSSHGLMHDKRQKTVFKMNNKPSKHSPLTAVIGNDAIDITPFLIEKRGFSASYLSRIGSVILTELKGLQNPTDEQINKEAQKLLLLLETFPTVLFTDRANERLLATGNPAPTNLEVMRLTIPEMCLFIVEHDRKHFPETHE